MLTPCPPGTPAVLPGELLNQAAVDFLRTGAEAGMFSPDAADSTVRTIRVAVHDVGADWPAAGTRSGRRRTGMRRQSQGRRPETAAPVAAATKKVEPG